jgi:F1F0 ATPase subunit 2
MSLDLFLGLLFSVLAGALVSLAYFGGLWLTVRGLRPDRNALLYLAASAAIRLGFILGAIVLAVLVGAEAHHLIAALVGFLLLRQILIVRVRKNHEATGATPRL